MMRKINYRDSISPSLEEMVKPSKSRHSIGSENNVGEYFFIKRENLLPFKKQARKTFCDQSLQELAGSIKQYGIRQPLSVIPSEDHKGKYEVVSGERRLRASILLDIEKIPCLIVSKIQEADEIALIENLHREDLHPIELGCALKNLMEEKNIENQNRLCEMLSMSKTKVSESLSYVKIHLLVREYLINKKINSRSIIRKALKYTKEGISHEQILDILQNNKNYTKKDILKVEYQNNQFVIKKATLEGLSQKDIEVLKNQIISLLDETIGKL